MMTGGGMGGREEVGMASLGGVAYRGAGLIARLTGLLFRWGRVEVGQHACIVIYHMFISALLGGPWHFQQGGEPA